MDDVVLNCSIENVNLLLWRERDSTNLAIKPWVCIRKYDLFNTTAKPLSLKPDKLFALLVGYSDTRSK